MSSGLNPKKLVRKVVPKRLVPLAEEAYRKGRLSAVHVRYGLPARKLKVIAVTGTNGKTTTCSFINEMLKHAGFTTAMFTTAEIELNGKKTPNQTNRTVVLTSELFGLLKRAAKEKVDYVVLEVTSMALHQHKLWGIPIEVAVMTNLTQEHLDYHKSMEQYAAAKARLFNRYMHPKICVLNHDDDWYDFFAKESVGRVISYGQHPDSTFHVKDIASTNKGSQIRAAYDSGPVTFNTQLIGKFNAYNAAAAITIGLALGIDKEKVTMGVAALAAVPGRMEPVQAGQPFTVLVDYAVTPDALHNALETLKETTKGSLHIVFGATGDRDKLKRPIMGRVVAGLADKIYLTDEETYSENPDAIRQAVYKGIEEAGGAKKTTIIPDRLSAIQAALKSAKPGDTVLITGMGHQSYRNMGGKKIPWNEPKEVNELLGQISH